MSILRTHNLQNPDSSSINIVMDQGGNTNITGVTTVGSNFHVTSGSVGIGTNNPAVNLHSYHATTNTVAKFESGDAGVNIRFKDGDTTNEMGIGAAGNDFIVTAASGGERLRVTSAGNLGIGGLTNPGALLSIPAGESNTPRLAIESAVDDNDFTITQYEDGNGTYTMLGQNVKLNSGGNNTVLDSAHRTAGILFDARNHGSLVFLTGGANAVGENVKIDSGGRLLVGTTSLIDGSTASNFQIASASGPRLCIARNNTNVTGGNLMGAIDFYGNDSDGTYEICGRMILEADGTHTTDSKPTRMAFYTTPDGSDTATERLRITNAGHVSIVGDNQKLLIGAGDDLQIYHNGSHSFIENNTGELLIRAKSGENSINCNPDGSIELFHDNTKRFETMSSGVKITNNLYLGGSTNGGFSYNSIADTLEFLTTNGGTHSELNSSAYVPGTNGGKHLGNHNKRWDNVFCNGIRFGGNNTVSTTLDGYEEGAYVPRLFAGTGTTEPSYNWRYGQYVRIGEVVTVWGAMGISGSVPTASQTYIGGLPYNQAFNNNNFFHYTQLHGYTWASGYSDSSSDTRLFLQTANGNNDKLLIVNGASKNYATHAMFGSGQRLTFCVSYVIG